MRLVQISDPHIFADQEARLLGLNTFKSFTAVLDLIEENPALPDAVILTGDLSQDESAQAYRHIAKACERFSCPVYWIPGNHDAPALMQKIFSQTAVKEDKTILLDNWLLVLLDTHHPKHVSGQIADTELARLTQAFSEYPHRHVLLFMHHHPVPVGASWIDTLALKNADDFFARADQHVHLRGIVFGHVHQVFETCRHGVTLLSAPSTCIQFLPRTEKFALDTLNPGYRWIELNTDGSFTTGIERVKNFENTVDFSSQGY